MASGARYTIEEEGEVQLCLNNIPQNNPKEVSCPAASWGCKIKALVIRPQRYEEFYSGTVRYGIFAKSRYTGIFRYGISLIFYPRIFRELFDSFCFFFIAAIGDQFRELLGLLHIHKLPKVRHHNKHYHQWGKVK